MGNIRMEKRKIIYYEDELNDEFSTAKIIPRKIDENYKYDRGVFWDICSYITQNIISMLIKVPYQKIKFRLKYVGKEKIKPYKKKGYFMYGNHTQAFADTFIPSVAIYPKRNFLIVNPENVSMKGIQTLAELLGAIPIPETTKGMKNFISIVEKRIKQNYTVSIYPEAHIWPYYTKIRPFKDVSFKYPVNLDVPAFCFTNTYQKRGKNKVKIVSYIDGPFFADKSLSKKEQQKDLRDRIYNKMVERSKNSNIEIIKYIKRETKEEITV